MRISLLVVLASPTFCRGAQGTNVVEETITVHGGLAESIDKVFSMPEEYTTWVWRLKVKAESNWRHRKEPISLKNPGGGWELNVESDDCGGNASFTSVEVDANSPELRFQQRFEGDVFPCGDSPGKPPPTDWMLEFARTEYYVSPETTNACINDTVTIYAYEGKDTPVSSTWTIEPTNSVTPISLPAGASVTFSATNANTFTITGTRQSNPENASDLSGEATVIIFGVDLDIDANYDGIIDDDDDAVEVSSGGLVALNMDDDNTNGIPDKLDTGTVQNEDDLKAIVLKFEPPESRSGKLTLDAVSGGSKIKIWESPTKGSLATNSWTVSSNTFQKTLYVEGIEPSSTSARDVELRLRYTDDNDNTQIDDNVTLTIIKVDLTNIKFNHDTGSSASDAINIRQDYTTPIDISNGEWVKGGVNHPVAYTADNSVTIKARFTVQPDSITSADIWAISTDSDGSLGDVVKTTVAFSGGVSVGDADGYVELPVSGNTPNVVKKTTTDAWQWKAENINGASLVCDFDVSGPHTVYTTLNEPMSPWVNTFGNQRNAWVKALVFAIETAGGQNKNDSDALAAITSYLHTGHGLTYHINSGAPAYASSSLGGTMDLTGYIDKSSGNTINCYDQASGVFSLGRLLGIGVEYRYMDPFGYINTVNLVGEGNCNNPFYPLTAGGKIAGADDVYPDRSGFGNHAFAKYGGNIYDACAGPHTGTRTEAQYVSDTVDSSTPAEAAVAGDTTDINPGAVTDLQ
ncbi:MAG: hypothetical protein ACOX52_23140 [Verrucomicrobiota bacterium]|jgi:hypothetical protein